MAIKAEPPFEAELTQIAPKLLVLTIVNYGYPLSINQATNPASHATDI